MTDERPEVLITRLLPQEALTRVVGQCELTLYDGDGAMPRDKLLASVAGKIGAVTLLTDRVDDEFLAAAGAQLKIVANCAVGYDNIDLAACTSHGCWPPTPLMCSPTPLPTWRSR